MSTINDIIVSLAHDELVDANSAFQSIMKDKTSQFLDDAKIDIANSALYGEDSDEDDDEYEDDYEGEYEDDEEDDEEDETDD
jgi:hypothetical protein